MSIGNSIRFKNNINYSIQKKIRIIIIVCENFLKLMKDIFMILKGEGE